MKSVVDKFWSQLAGPNLFLRSKRCFIQRNVAIENIVWIADQNALGGEEFKLSRVITANPDSKGIVRDVNV